MSTMLKDYQELPPTHPYYPFPPSITPLVSPPATQGALTLTQLSRIDHVEQQLIERLSQLLERRHTEMDDLDERLATLSARLAPALDQELDPEVPDDSEDDGERDED